MRSVPSRTSLMSESLSGMRVALVHHWLLGMHGSEQVLEALCRIFPGADIFTLFYNPNAVSPLIRSRNVQASFLNPLQNVHRLLLPALPMALENFDLRGYDLIISNESGPAKGVLAPAGARHFCYCYTPMRCLWELYPAYRREFGGNRLERGLLALFASRMRVWDYASAARVDGFIAASRHTGRRIRRAYRRRSAVVYPPVAIETFRREPAEDYFLMIGEMLPYKQFDYAIRAFSKSGRKLLVAGDGPEYRRLRKIAGRSVEFCGQVKPEDIRTLYARSRALIVPGEKDFGITMVESLASGKPVIALGRGGANEIIGSGCGILYPNADEEALEEALRSFEQSEALFSPRTLKERAAWFSESEFRTRFLEALSARWSETPRTHKAKKTGPFIVPPTAALRS